MNAKLNTFLANLGVLYIKVHNLHWNVNGPSFVQVHEYLEVRYDQIAERLDQVAEYIRMRDAYPLASLKDYLENTTIKEFESKKISIFDSLKSLYDDTQSMKELATEIRNEADEVGDFVLVAMMEDFVTAYDKDLWFMRSMLNK